MTSHDRETVIATTEDREPTVNTPITCWCVPSPRRSRKHGLKKTSGDTQRGEVPMTAKDRETLIAEARDAVTQLRDYARQFGMDHHRRDPLVWKIHRALDALALVREDVPQPTPCYCCRGEWDPVDGGHPEYCQSGCRCYGRCDNQNCCESDQGSLS
jgi:hypothetical protein